MSLFSIILNLIFMSHAALGEDFILQHKDQQIKISFQKSDGLLVNDLCLEKLKDCKAMSEAHITNGMPKIIKGNLGNPAQNFCKTINGTALTLFRADKSSMSFCLFDDQTIISSWDLYNFRKKYKKE